LPNADRRFARLVVYRIADCPCSIGGFYPIADCRLPLLDLPDSVTATVGNHTNWQLPIGNRQYLELVQKTS
jgi:hypothetical protein